jgi:hypothetical protein
MMKPILLLALLVSSSFLGACGHELFTHADTGSRRINTYYDGDSAVQTRENRRKTETTGFGYPTGAFQQ